MGTADAGDPCDVAVENEDKKDKPSPHDQIYCTIDVHDDFFQANLKEFENSIDCIKPTCSGVGTRETVVNAAKNRKYATCCIPVDTNINGTCSFVVGYTGELEVKQKQASCTNFIFCLTIGTQMTLLFGLVAMISVAVYTTSSKP